MDNVGPSLCTTVGLKDSDGTVVGATEGCTDIVGLSDGSPLG